MITPTPVCLLLLVLGLLPAVLAAWHPWLGYVAAVFDAVVLALWLADGTMGFSPRWIKVERLAGLRLSVGVSARVSLRVRSFTPLSLRLRVVDGWPPEFETSPAELRFRLAPFQETTVDSYVLPRMRGEFNLGAVAGIVRGALGLADRRILLGEPAAVRVYPDLEELKRFDLLTRKRLLRQTGVRRVRQVGRGREFERLREYVPGDEYRTIDWKATARRLRPISRVYELERAQNVLIALDAGRLMAAASGPLTKLDRAINAAILLSHVAMRSGDRVGLLVFSNVSEQLIPPRSGRASITRIMETLVPLQPRPTAANYRTAVETVITRMRRRAMIFMITDIADEQSARDMSQFVPLLRPNHLPVVVAFRDEGLERLADAVPPGPAGLYEHAAAIELRHEWRRTLLNLSHRGVGVVDVLPQDAPVASVNKYLELKQRQLG